MVRAALRAALLVNAAAHEHGRPSIDLINHEEHQRILELIEADTWPARWTGRETRGDILLPQVLADGIIQSLLEETTL